jgi:hypothetical protein
MMIRGMPAGSTPAPAGATRLSDIRLDIDPIKLLYGITRGPANDYTYLVYNLTDKLALTPLP